MPVVEFAAHDCPPISLPWLEVLWIYFRNPQNSERPTFNREIWFSPLDSTKLSTFNSFPCSELDPCSVANSEVLPNTAHIIMIVLLTTSWSAQTLLFNLNSFQPPIYTWSSLRLRHLPNLSFSCRITYCSISSPPKLHSFSLAFECSSHQSLPLPLLLSTDHILTAPDYLSRVASTPLHNVVRGLCSSNNPEFATHNPQSSHK